MTISEAPERPEPTAARRPWAGSFAALFVALLAATSALGGTYRAPRNAAGQPDLQGFWTNLSATKLERRPNTPLTFPTVAEERAFEAEIAEASKHPSWDVLGQVASEWLVYYPAARMNGRLRTSWIVSPSDGRLPYTPEARRHLAALRAAIAAPAADPEDRTPSDRCLVAGGGASGPPILNPFNSGDYQIIQIAGAVAILSETNHDLRIVRLGGRHPSRDIRVWMGDSIGHWEGDTLGV
jgi:hypothetical protein